MSLITRASSVGGGLAIAAAVAVLVSPTAGADPQSCVDAWNSDGNASAQDDLQSLYADGGAGNVVAAVEDGGCVVAAYHVDQPSYVVFRQRGGRFVESDGGPADQFWPYVATVDAVNVVVQEWGGVEPVA